MSTQEPEKGAAAAFRAWLTEHGGYFHPDAYFHRVSSGYSILAKAELPPDATVVSCPFSLAITPELARRSLLQVLTSPKGGEEHASVDNTLSTWSERQLISTYICMHWITKHPSLGHQPYIDTLPARDRLRTPLHFTPQELEAFRGSNVYGATLDRRREWEAEHNECMTLIQRLDPEWGRAFTWDRYCTAATYLSSRAFPSTLLSLTPTNIATPTSHPVLLPGVDALNHARAHPVSWVVSAAPATATPDNSPSISLVLRTATPTGAELFNNYGPKPNAELILGYGFALPDNPDDTIVLKAAGMPTRWEVGRGARGADVVWEALLRAVGGGEDGDEEQDLGCSVQTAEILAEMAGNLRQRLPEVPQESEFQGKGLREEVWNMLRWYVEGQSDILASLEAFAREKGRMAEERAKELGIDLEDIEEDDEGEQ